MSIARQVLITVFFLAAIAGGGYWFLEHRPSGNDASASGERKRPPPQVETRQPERHVMAHRIEAVGTTLAKQAIDIVPLTSGRVTAVEFEPSSLVEVGDVLVRLDATSERANVQEAEVDLKQARLAFERSQRLRADNAVAQATFEQQEAAFRAAGARLERVQKELADRLITAPFAGRTGLRQVSIGARVAEDSVLTTLDDLSEVEIEFSVPEIFFGGVRQGQSVKATAVAFGERAFEGKINVIDSRIDPVSRAFKARAIVPNPDFALPAGMFVHVELVLSESEQLTLPEEALLTSGDATYVFLIVDGKAVRRDVELGRRELGLVAITAGLTGEDHVVVSGLQRLRPGMTVQHAEPPAPPVEPDQPATTSSEDGSSRV